MATNTSGGGTTIYPLEINGRTYNVFDHSPKWQGHGDGRVSKDGSTLSITDNAWKYVPISANLTRDSVLSFDFSSTKAGEIHAIGFVNGDSLDDSVAFQFLGSQDWGLEKADWSYAANSGTKTITIPVGQYATGRFDRLVFVTDDDAGVGANSTFANVTLTSGQPTTTRTTGTSSQTVKTGEESAGGLKIDGSTYAIKSFAPRIQDAGKAVLTDGGSGVRVTDNAWKYVDIDASLTRDTVLSFDFASSRAGEIHAIGFANGDSPDARKMFQLSGVQSWGRRDADWSYSTGSGTKSIDIDVGKYLTGKYDRLVFVMDDDAGRGGDSLFKNISLKGATASTGGSNSGTTSGGATGGGTSTKSATGLKVNGKTYKVEAYDPRYQDEGKAILSGDGSAVTLTDNAWKAVSLPTNITRDTVLSFDFASGNEGEIHGIGFAKGGRYSDKTIFQLAGTQSWGRESGKWDYDIGSGTKSFDIRVGDYFTGSYDKLVFVMDDDADTGGTSRFSNIEVSRVPLTKTTPTTGGSDGGGTTSTGTGSTGGSSSGGSGGGDAKLVISTGQSLTVGATEWSTREVITKTPIDPDKALNLDWSGYTYDGRGWQSRPVDTGAFQGFQPMREHVTETHASGMIDAILSDYAKAGKTAPTFVHFNAGAGGKSVQELSGGVLLDNMRKQLNLVAREAKKEGLDFDDDVYVYFNQGAANSSTSYADYKRLLKSYFDKIDNAADSAFGRDMDVKMLVAPGNGYNIRNVPIAQLDLAEEHPDIYAGRTSHLTYEYSSLDYTPTGHLSPWGYNVMGQHAGHYLYDIMQGRPDAPMLISNVQQTGARSIKVTMSGVEGRLVYDDDWIEPFARIRDVPDHFGFRLFTDRGYEGRGTPMVKNSKISGANTVDLTFDRDIDGDWRLYLGRPGGDDVVAGTTLRESAIDRIIVPSHMRGDRDVVTTELDEYAPVQYVDVDFW